MTVCDCVADMGAGAVVVAMLNGDICLYTGKPWDPADTPSTSPHDDARLGGMVMVDSSDAAKDTGEHSSCDELEVASSAMGDTCRDDTAMD